MACNKREPGTGWGAIAGFNHIYAILGASKQCIVTHPSDMCVALAALDAVVISKVNGNRQLPITEFHRLLGDRRHTDTNLQADELIIAVDLLRSAFAQ
ncbi:MAG: FAD binding domain-containing protein [Nostoc sp.]|uniref:FAD binding domain-containing protein n=1 Tax=Nostoc sp. TaxID=1180 RepID=UPI002FEFBDD4